MGRGVGGFIEIDATVFKIFGEGSFVGSGSFGDRGIMISSYIHLREISH